MWAWCDLDERPWYVFAHFERMENVLYIRLQCALLWLLQNRNGISYEKWPQTHICAVHVLFSIAPMGPNDKNISKEQWDEDATVLSLSVDIRYTAFIPNKSLESMKTQGANLQFNFVQLNRCLCVWLLFIQFIQSFRSARFLSINFPLFNMFFFIVVAFTPAIAIELHTVLHLHDLKYLWCFDVLHSIVKWRLWTAFVLCEQPPLHLLIADSVLFSSSPQKLNKALCFTDITSIARPF